jgi:hypothetical protein
MKLSFFLFFAMITFNSHGQAVIEVKEYEQIKKELQTVLNDDQKYRKMSDSVRKNYGQNSSQMLELRKLGLKADSINIAKLLPILDKYGWLSKEEVGEQGNDALFLVIQHSDLKTQLYYKPMMDKAVFEGKLRKSSYVMLVDRINVGQSKKQIYGTQVHFNEKGEFSVHPIEDPENVDKRRHEMGLPTMSEYLKHWNKEWNLEEHKKQSELKENKN